MEDAQDTCKKYVDRRADATREEKTKSHAD